MENNIKILRFKDGQDVICRVLEETLKSINIEDPMVFEVRNANLMIQQWLPIAVVKNNTVQLKQQDVLCMFEPNESFREYYEGLVSKINEVVVDNDLANANIDKLKQLLKELDDCPDKDTLVH